MAHSHLPPTMWEYALQDTVDKYNESYHHGIYNTPASKWNATTQGNNNFLPFGQYGFAIDPQKPKKSNQHRSRLAQYLCRYDLNQYIIYLVHSNRVTKTRVNNFQVYSPFQEPETYTTVPIQTQCNQTNTATSQCPNTPRTLKQARESTNQSEWRDAYNTELD